VLARAGDAAAVAVTPTGGGLIAVVGAMDAWRYRDADAGAFDRFWRSLAAELAAAHAPVRITFDRPVARAGSRMPFTVRAESASEVSAVARCGEGPAEAVSLWPAGTRDVFRGELAVADRLPCRLDVTAGTRLASAGIAVVDTPVRAVSDVLGDLERDVRRSGGTVARRGDLSPIATDFERSVRLEGQPAPFYPMRSAWWLLPFAALLSIEWWLRRRSGLR
jgi:hypothetical protein